MQMVAFAKDPKGENIFAESRTIGSHSTNGTHGTDGRQPTRVTTMDRQLTQSERKTQTEVMWTQTNVYTLINEFIDPYHKYIPLKLAPPPSLHVVIIITYNYVTELDGQMSYKSMICCGSQTNVTTRA